MADITNTIVCCIGCSRQLLISNVNLSANEELIKHLVTNEISLMTILCYMCEKKDGTKALPFMRRMRQSELMSWTVYRRYSCPLGLCSLTEVGACARLWTSPGF